MRCQRGLHCRFRALHPGLATKLKCSGMRLTLVQCRHQRQQATRAIGATAVQQHRAIGILQQLLQARGIVGIDGAAICNRQLQLLHPGSGDFRPLITPGQLIGAAHIHHGGDAAGGKYLPVLLGWLACAVNALARVEYRNAHIHDALPLMNNDRRSRLLTLGRLSTGCQRQQGQGRQAKPD